ncbi:MAG: flippase-like domain-containing protein, partial [Methanobacterium sp.]
MKQIYVFIISIALIILLVFWIGPSNIMEALKSANWWLILLAVLIHLLVVGIRSLRWGFIIKQSKEFRKN